MVNVVIVLSGGEMALKKVAVNTINGHVTINIRQFQKMEDGSIGPNNKKGIALNVYQWEQLKLKVSTHFSLLQSVFHAYKLGFISVDCGCRRSHSIGGGKFTTTI